MKKINEHDFAGFVGRQESQFIIPASDLTDDVVDVFENGSQIAGVMMPWSKTHNYVRLRPGEVSIWCGVNGHGKSLILNQVCAWTLHEAKWLIASLEMKPMSTMYRMCRQISGRTDPTVDYVKRFMSWTDDRLWIYDQLDTVEPDRIIGMIHYAATQLGIQHILIDSLMKCGLGGPDDYNAQKKFIDRLCWAAKSNNVHIHLVAHMRKGISENHQPDKFDIKGASEISDMVDNVFIVHRNKDKEEKVRLKKEVDSEMPDCTLRVAKQRHGEWEGVFNFWFHGEGMQYVPNSSLRAMPFLPLQ